MTQITRRIMAVPLGLLAVGVGAVVYYGFIHNTRHGLEQVKEPTCTIRFLSRDDRLNPDPEKGHFVNISEYGDPYPADQVSNPVLFQDRFAMVRFANTTDQDLNLHMLSGWPPEPELQKWNRDMALDIQKGLVQGVKNQRLKDHLVKILEDAPRPTSVRSAFIVHVDVVDLEGKVTEVVDYTHSLEYGVRMPPREHLFAGNRPTFRIQPGEGIDLPMPILGKMREPRLGLKPTTYTVRASVSYAEAPSGEMKRVTSEPVTVTVTEEHIKAAEAFWATPKN